MTIEARTRRKYTLEFEQNAMALVKEQCYGISQAARSHDINDSVLRR